LFAESIDAKIVNVCKIKGYSVLIEETQLNAMTAEEIGERVMYRLCREIEDGTAAQEAPEPVPHKLIVRQSVARPRD
jgi:hypothetical protein